MGLKMAYRVPHQQPSTMQLSVPEHVVVLQFENDDDALAFSDWWNEVGSTDFGAWVKVAQEKDGIYQWTTVEEI